MFVVCNEWKSSRSAPKFHAVFRTRRNRVLHIQSYRVLHKSRPHLNSIMRAAPTVLYFEEIKQSKARCMLKLSRILFPLKKIK